MSDDDLTPEESYTILKGLYDLGGIDARMTILQQTVIAYRDHPDVARGHYGQLLNDAADAIIAWQALRATPFGALFDPTVIPPEEEPPDDPGT